MYSETFTCDQCKTNSIPPSDPKGWFCTSDVSVNYSIVVHAFDKGAAKEFGVKCFCGVPCLLKNLSDEAPKLLGSEP